MGKVTLILITALFTAGCFFGGESDSPTSITKEDPKTNDSLPAVKKIVPGLYAGEYDWIDTAQQGYTSQLLLNSDGSYRFIYARFDYAAYDEFGNWFQKDSAFYFSGNTDCVADNFDGIFYAPNKAEDDTTAIANITDTSFLRREYTPLRQKPYWIPYKRKNVPAIKDGNYAMVLAPVSDSMPYEAKLVIDLAKNEFTFSYHHDNALTDQFNSKYDQVGSFLITKEVRYRAVDSTNVLGDWGLWEGYEVQTLKSISDTSFSWITPLFSLNAGVWETYKKAPAE
jgi:hypothetical protein